ncbi:FadR/GntR family transcriptional regulator [Devosia sp. 2618]|uniref:FadR/GntR family transcriptional regulator n=1 Tax=Devosia sp. 2618 TaxID=3156454 RepID=UPI00339A7028
MPPPDKSAARLPSLEPLRLYRQIAALLMERMEQGLFPVGTFLPAERTLADQLGVSRTSVREAMIALEVAGKVSIRQGHGVQVLPQMQALGVSAQDDVGPIQAMEARRVIEPRIAAKAATNRSDIHLEAMRLAMALQAEGQSTKEPKYRQGDRGFHLEIARASGNPAYEIMVTTLWDYRHNALFERFESLLLKPERIANTQAEHAEIYQAIADGDSNGAAKAMQRHIDAVLAAFVAGKSEIG